MLSINPEIGRLVGVHMGTINLRVAVTDMSGNVLAHQIDRSLVQQAPEKSLARMLRVIMATAKAANVKKENISAIGLGIEGIMDRKGGVILSWPKVPSWINVPVRSFVQDNLNTLVEVEDTPRTMALAERRLGKGRGVNEFIYLTLGAGTGSALFFGGRLYTGKEGFAGEFGHTTIDEKGSLCSCGNRGCVEASVSASTIIQRAKEALALGVSSRLHRVVRENGGTVTLETIARAAEANDRFCLSLLTEVGLHIGTGVAGLINLLNPELVVLGGGLPKAAGKWLLPPIKRMVQERALENSAKNVSIELSDLDEIDWARGATFLVSEKAIHRILSNVE
jgi:predicted NBD/HSP70 family sugar kinase